MSANFIEEMVTEYYRTKGYLVHTNYWFPFESVRKRIQKGVKQGYSARSWSDIDVLAIGEKELLLIQVKAIINESKSAEKIIDFFEKTHIFLDNGKAPGTENSIKWWIRGKAVRNIVVYEFYSPPKYIKQLKDVGIEVQLFSDYFKEIITNANDRKGFKEENALMRMIHFMNHNNYINVDEGG